MLTPQMLQSFQSGNAVQAGEMALNDVQALQKSLEMGYGSDVSTLTGGGALRIQSLEKTMLSTIQENKHFALFNELAKGTATATVDEWTEMSSVGGRLGGSTNSETGTIAGAQGQYNRRVGMVKYLMTRREVSFVATLGNNIVEAEAIENQNGALQLLTDAEFLCFEGDSSVIPTEFDGIGAQMQEGVNAGQVSGDNILDAQGDSLASVDLVNRAAAIISGYGNFGRPTHIFMSQSTQADFDTGLDPAFRVPLNDVPGGGIQIGAPVVGIRTSHGNIKTVSDVFIRDENQKVPYEVLNPGDAALYAAMKPASVVATDAGSASDSQFSAARSGNYYWFVTGLNAAGESTGTASAQFGVTAGHNVTVTITGAAGGTETGYAVYRGRLNGTGAATDVRLMARIPKAGATTVYTDKNRDIPGATTAYILNMAPGAMAINWRQLLPMIKFNLYPTVSAVVPWAQMMFGYLRIGKRRQHVVIKNIVPSSAAWKPFG